MIYPCHLKIMIEAIELFEKNEAFKLTGLPTSNNAFTEVRILKKEIHFGLGYLEQVVIYNREDKVFLLGA